MSLSNHSTTPTNPGAIAFAAPTPLDERTAGAVSEYDRYGWLYDFVVSSQLYHRVVWGMSPSEHARFAEHALQASAPRAVLDAGCGSLVFTAKSYANAERRFTLFDGSRGMLARAQKRLSRRARNLDARFRFVQGDLLDLPFEPQSQSCVFHFGVLHCLEHIDPVLSGLHRVTAPGGQLFLSSLVLGRPRGDSFLRRLHRAGHIARPRTASALLAHLDKQGWKVTSSWQRGSFAFIEAERT